MSLVVKYVQKLKDTHKESLARQAREIQKKASEWL